MNLTTLQEISEYRSESLPYSLIDQDTYVSTESMLSDKRGITAISKIPSSGNVKKYYMNDILVSNIRPYFKKVWLAEYDGTCSNDVLVFHSTGCLPNFLYLLLSSDAFFSYMSKTSKGTKMPRGDKRAIMKYEVKVPNLQTQLKICEIMDSFQSKIKINHRLNDYLNTLLDIEFNELVVKNSSSWKLASLLDIANYKNGLAMQKFRPVSIDAGLPVLKIRELGQGFCGSDAERCRSDIEESVIVHNGDLIFSWSGTLLLDFWAGGNAGLNQHLFKVTSNKYPSWFYYCWTKHHMQRFISMAKDRATTMGHIKRSALQESEVYIPRHEIMQELTKHMQPLVDELVNSKVESYQLIKLKESLLPKLISGQIDLSGSYYDTTE
jgi:ribosomal protein L10